MVCVACFCRYKRGLVIDPVRDRIGPRRIYDHLKTWADTVPHRVCDHFKAWAETVPHRIDNYLKCGPIRARAASMAISNRGQSLHHHTTYYLAQYNLSYGTLRVWPKIIWIMG